ncbi:MAG: serine/threonine protein kinase, partial [Sphingobacteriales bacterium]
ILVRVMKEYDETAIELISIDNGPGMAEPLRMIEDGMSTSNTLGNGLGAMKRLSDTFQVYSVKDWGTIVLSRVYREDKPQFPQPLRAEVRPLIIAKPGEEVSGDGAYFTLTADHLKIFLGDGLGHGKDAHAAVRAAIRAFRTSPEKNPIEIIRYIHTEVKKTRGLVGAVAVYSFKSNTWSICGVGNIAARTQNALAGKAYLSYNGIIGMNIPGSLKEQLFPGERGQLVILCSDGIRTRWELQKYAGIFKYDLSVMAAAIYKDHARNTDDMSVVIARVNAIS